MKIYAVIAASVATLGASLLVAGPAEAHTPNFSATCDGVHVGATAYDAAMQNHWSVTIDGATQSGTFGSSFDQTFPVPQDGATTAWSAVVEAEDGTYHFADSGSVGPCGTPADACADLPGNQPAGTACTPPPDVTRVDHQSLEGCSVQLDGTAYGAGVLTYDEEYTDTYVFNETTQTWDLVTDTTPTTSNLVFTPWTVQQGVHHQCATQPNQPPATHTSHSTSHVECTSDEVVTTTVSSTTPFVYDAATNTWVPGQTVTQTSTTSTPVQQGRCSHTDVKGTQAVQLTAQTDQQLPTVVDAGLPGATVVQVSPVASTSSTGNALSLLLLTAGSALLVLAGAGVRRGTR
ncbi:hypothetical protein FB382_000204 [Nocardioides ginsengisegetis]|uniref:Gram-positive cocci surface proteins LPxTG domain-containing protein n=1 Tax=Nocardioides ginsengisegetis TaxID=661491 RepID=A0A7W3P7Z6_9ACTN|nr:hypothetical protein [Nocardioides ginsengisegetis]MBA8801913.1 hypothetical protein [Nocardioides ginsengisegetis]